MGAQGAAAQQPDFAADDTAAQQPAFFAFAFFSFLDLAEQALQPREAGAQVADAALGATAIANPPATANIVARFIEFRIVFVLLI